MRRESYDESGGVWGIVATFAWRTWGRKAHSRGREINRIIYLAMAQHLLHRLVAYSGLCRSRPGPPRTGGS